MTKKLSDIWQFYHRDATIRTNLKATCKTCGKQLQGIVSKLRKHLAECPKHFYLDNDDVEIICQPQILSSSSVSATGQVHESMESETAATVEKPVGSMLTAFSSSSVSLIETESLTHSETSSRKRASFSQKQHLGTRGKMDQYSSGLGPSEGETAKKSNSQSQGHV
jgi:hypothetical protein